MEIGLYDVVLLKDGREGAVLMIFDEYNELLIDDTEDAPFPVDKSEVEKVIWSFKENRKTP